MPNLTSLSESIGALLKETGESLSVSESSCGGLISATLVAVPGASAYYVGGSVVYTRAAQQGLLDVPESAMEGIRASSEPYAQLNARTIRERLGTTWAVSETGASGPTGNRYGDSAGHACIAVVRARWKRPSPSKRATTTAKTTCGYSPKQPWTCWKSACGRRGASRLD